MSVRHNFRLAHVHTKAHLLRNSAEVIDYRIKVTQSLCYYDHIVDKPKLSDVLAVDVDANPFQTRSLKTSSNAAVNSFGEITSDCRTPRCSWIGFVVWSCIRTDIVAFLYKHFKTLMYR
ncbi:jg8780 [Pararge aegeria aegeria]|uniref:Jg8780 protein n=1 Tax=Pararge aegeria aegeria TaxID=348720 RepID=A0A8S4S7C8_9NEOP|nr:jg8780 [Pararge aegeria aegeria]